MPARWGRCLLRLKNRVTVDIFSLQTQTLTQILAPKVATLVPFDHFHCGCADPNADSGVQSRHSRTDWPLSVCMRGP